MNCPFCAEEIKDAAIVCKHCTRDLSIPKAVLDENRALTQTVATLEEEIAHLRQRVDERLATPAPVAKPIGTLGYLFGFVLAPIVLLVAIHYLLVMKLDINPIYLRVASMLIPLPFGYALARRAKPTWRLLALIVSLTGFASVMAMSAVVGVIDGIPILPSSAFEWRETIEYMLSIGLAYILGALVAPRVGFRPSAGSKGRIVDRIATQVALNVGSLKSGKPLEHRIEWVEKMLNSSLAISAAFGSIYTGLKAFIG